MEIKVELSAEQINSQICEVIAKSAIGEELQKTIDTEVKKLSQSYNNPFKNIVANHINNAVQEIVKEQYADQIKEMVKEKVTEKFTEELFTKLWESFQSRY